MALTKRELINQAFTEIGLGSSTYTKTAEDWQDALTRLNALLADWSTRGAMGGYELNTGSLDDTLDEDAGIPPNGVRGVICGLAMDLAPSYGKEVMADTRRTAAKGKRTLRNASIYVPQKTLDYTAIAAGAGNKTGLRSRRVNLTPTTDDITDRDQSNG